MTTKVITTGDASFVIKSRMPSDWDTDAVVTITIADKAGNDLVTSAATTQYAGDTISQATVAGRFTAYLVTGTALESGNQVVIGSDAEDWHNREVDSYDAATKKITFTKGLGKSLKAGSEIRGLDISYTVDASAAAWDDLTEVEVIWEPDSDNQPNPELWAVRTIKSSIAGLEEEFQAAFTDLYNKIIDQEFSKYSTRGRSRVKSRMEMHGRNMDLIVDSEILKEITLIEIAVVIANTYPMEEVLYSRLLKDREDQWEILNNLKVWQDTNEDEIEDEAEAEKGLVFDIQRGL